MKQWGELKMYLHECENQQDEKHDRYKLVVYNFDYKNNHTFNHILFTSCASSNSISVKTLTDK